MATKKKVKEVAVSFVRKLELVDKKCLQCGTVFTGVKRARFCGLPCKNRWNYVNHADARRAHRREVYHAEKSAGHAGKK